MVLSPCGLRVKRVARKPWQLALIPSSISILLIFLNLFDEILYETTLKVLFRHKLLTFYKYFILLFHKCLQKYKIQL
jgi:hypothetical protein